MTGRVLVLNCGSSSVKYRLLEPDSGAVLIRGLVERIGAPDGRLQHGDAVQDRDFADHHQAMDAVLAAFAEHGPKLPDGLVAVGHRVVHGGSRFSAPTLVDDDVLAAIEDLAALAPLHNPANVTGIRAARTALPDVPHVAVFDTAFHTTMPERAATYAVPRDWREEHGVRKYGFHGTSHGYVARETARLLDRPAADTHTIVLHLGNGASATAVRGGVSVDTSMGLTPLEGLVMGTRSGDVDPAVGAYLHRVAGLDFAAVDDTLQRHAGLLGLAGVNDMRTVLERRAAGDEAAALAFDVYCHRIRKYVGAFHAVLGRLDAVVFTAGVGEHAPAVRAASLSGLETWGIAVDEGRNVANERLISADGARVAVCVVPTDEEHAIAEQTAALVL